MTSVDDENLDDQRQDSDYDGAWKELLRSHLNSHLNEVIRECFPRLASLIDWNFEPEWLDKEISQIVGKSGRRNRSVDMLFRVRLISGHFQWILCHLEIQTSYEAGFPFRIDLCHAGDPGRETSDLLSIQSVQDLADWKPAINSKVAQFKMICTRSPIRI